MAIGTNSMLLQEVNTSFTNLASLALPARTLVLQSHLGAT
jgi:hypothetical protein